MSSTRYVVACLSNPPARPNPLAPPCVATCAASTVGDAVSIPGAGRDNARLGASRRPVPRRPPVSIVRMSDLDLAGKRVLIREDLNVPIGDAGRITSEQRIPAAVPTLELALSKGAAGM